MFETFTLLVAAILPLYGLIAVGYFAGKFFDVDRKTIGSLGIYILMPIVAFGFVLQLEFKPEYFALPVVYCVLLCLSAIGWLAVGQKIYGHDDNRANLLALCATWANNGYFGLPLVMALFSPDWVALYIFIILGGSVFEATVAYYIAARGAFSVKDSLVKLAKFPSLYAIVLAIIYNMSGVELSGAAFEYWGHFKGAYIVIGMMIIGTSLSKMKGLVIAPRFIGWSFFGKFVLFPLATVGVILLADGSGAGYALEVYKLFYILAIVPIGANIAAYAVEMNLRPGKAATTILISTVMGLVYIPAALIAYDTLIVPLLGR